MLAQGCWPAIEATPEVATEVVRYRTERRSVLRRPFDVIDDQHVHCGSRGLQLQPELIPQSGQHGRLIRNAVSRRRGAALPPTPRKIRRGVGRFLSCWRSARCRAHGRAIQVGHLPGSRAIRDNEAVPELPCDKRSTIQFVTVTILSMVALSACSGNAHVTVTCPPNPLHG
jgi:hypothetical protein